MLLPPLRWIAIGLKLNDVYRLLTQWQKVNINFMFTFRYTIPRTSYWYLIPGNCLSPGSDIWLLRTGHCGRCLVLRQGREEKLTYPLSFGEEVFLLLG